MKITIEIPDEFDADVRHAFMVQDVEATDEQLARAAMTYLLTTTARVRESEERAEAAAATTKSRETFLSKAGIETV